MINEITLAKQRKGYNLIGYLKWAAKSMFEMVTHSFATHNSPLKC